MDFLGIGTGEILLILIIATMVFGPQKLPEIGRTLGQATKKMKEAAGQLGQQMNEEMGDLKKVNQEVNDVINKEVLPGLEIEGKGAIREGNRIIVPAGKDDSEVGFF